MPVAARKQLESRNVRQCDNCGGVLELCPPDYPWNTEFWICVKCESTYPIETHEAEKDEPEIPQTQGGSSS